MSKSLVIALLALTATGCSTTKPSLAPVRNPPSECMVAPSVQLCTLRAEYVNLASEDQAAMELACEAANSAIRREAVKKWSCLKEYVNGP